MDFNINKSLYTEMKELKEQFNEFIKLIIEDLKLDKLVEFLAEKLD